MKCQIIRDLLPLYYDKLTSDESNKEIENHLLNCNECAEIYENMSKEEIIIKEQDKNIEPLKKVRKNFFIRLIFGILGTVIVLFGVFMFVFWGVVPISSDNLSWTFEKSSMQGFYGKMDDNENFIEQEKFNINFINMIFTGNCSCIRKRTDIEHIENTDGTTNNNYHITIYPVIRLPFDDRGENPNQFSWGFNTHNDNDTLTIHCRDKDITYYIKDLIEESGLTLE